MITLLAVIAKLFCSGSVLSNRMTSQWARPSVAHHMQVIGLEAQQLVWIKSSPTKLQYAVSVRLKLKPNEHG